jgi:hypothetical protein
MKQSPRPGAQCAVPPRVHLELLMHDTMRADRSPDRPTREPVDHADLERRQSKHPKSGSPSRGSERSGCRRVGGR